MRIRKIVNRYDFVDLRKYNSLSRFDCLAIVARKAYEKEKLSSFSLEIPMAEHRAIFTPSLKRKISEIEKPSNPVDAQLPILPQEFKDRIFSMGGTDPTMVLQKKLFMCDVNKNHARLSMPESECGEKLCLTKEEREKLEVRDAGNHLVGITVRVIEPNLEEREMSFRRWEYPGKASNFVLVKSWNQVAANNRLREGDDFQIWAFRVNGDIAFALVKLARNHSNRGITNEVEKHSGDFALQWGAKRRRN